MPFLTCSVRDLPRYPKAARWACVRHPMWRQDEWQANGILWVPALAPSRALLQWWKRGPATPERFHGYMGRWDDEKEGDGPYAEAVERAHDLSRRGVLVLACWCRDEGLCHRSLLATHLLRLGAVERVK